MSGAAGDGGRGGAVCVCAVLPVQPGVEVEPVLAEAAAARGGGGLCWRGWESLISLLIKGYKRDGEQKHGVSDIEASEWSSIVMYNFGVGPRFAYVSASSRAPK